MREIQRTIVSALIFSQDGKLLMGRKDPAKGGVYPDCWHIPGGGVDAGETMEKALCREVREETGLDISAYKLSAIPYVDFGAAEKTLKDTGEKVWCKMEFNRFRIDMNLPAEKIIVQPSDDLVEIKWFAPEELTKVKQVPGGRELFQKLGLLR